MSSLTAAFILFSISSTFSFNGKFKNSIAQFPRRQTSLSVTDKESLIEIRNRIEESDYSGAFQVLKRNPLLQLSTEDARSLLNNLDSLTIPTADLELNQKENLDSCTFLYKRLERQSVFKGFGCIADGEYPEKALDITPLKLEQVTGLNIKALTPKERTTYWRLAGIGLCLAEYGIGQQLGINPLYTLIPGTFILGSIDQLFYKGAGFESVYQNLFPEYKQKIIDHEAGHFLIAYLLGIPIRGCVTNAMEARKYPDIKGQAGTIFYDPRLEDELASGKIKRRTLDRLSVVIMAGIAAEAVQYGKAEGGASDEQSLVGFLTAIQPPWNIPRVQLQARWAAMQAILLIREHEASYKALCIALEEGSKVGDLILAIEENLPQTLPSSTRSVDQKMKMKDMESNLLMKYIQKITNRVGGINKVEYVGNVISNDNANRDLVKVGIDGYLIEQISVKQESAEMTKWRKSLKATTNIEENISKEKAWFEKDDNFSTDFKQKIKNLEKEKELSIKKSMDLEVKVMEESSVSVSADLSASDSVNDGPSTDVSASASTDNVSATGVIIDENQSNDILMPSNGSIFGDSRIRNVDLNTSDMVNDGEIATKLSDNRSNGSIFGDNSVSTADISEDFSVRDVINAYQEVQIENANKGDMIGPIQPDDVIFPKTNKVLEEVKEINRKIAKDSANISRDMLLSSRGYQLKKLENSKAGFAKKVLEVDSRIEELRELLEVTTTGKSRW